MVGGQCGLLHPVRQVLSAGTYAEANALSRSLTDALADVPAGPGLDDCLDACAAAWSAQRWMSRTARVLGLDADGNTSTDALGRPMRIVA